MLALTVERLVGSPQSESSRECSSTEIEPISCSETSPQPMRMIEENSNSEFRKISLLLSYNSSNNNNNNNNISTNYNNNKNTESPTRPKLSFSIHEILQPDFGLKRKRVEKNEESSRKILKSGKKSFRSLSEDSNSSCGSSFKKEEVIDEAKVNPEVPKGPLLWPAWVYCTRYSDRPSSGPRSRRISRKSPQVNNGSSSPRSIDSSTDDKRPRTAFTSDQLGRLKEEFEENRYLNEKRRQDLARDLKLHENQIKIWFQNKRAKLKKSTGQRGGLAAQLMAQGLYNHSTIPVDEDDEDYLPC